MFASFTIFFVCVVSVFLILFVPGFMFLNRKKNITPADDPPLSSMPIIDLNHLDQFTGGNREKEALLAAAFFKSAEKYSAIMSCHLQGTASDKEWYYAAHGLKGSAAQFGALHLETLGRRAEMYAGENGKEEKEMLYKEICAALQALHTLFGMPPQNSHQSLE